MPQSKITLIESGNKTWSLEIEHDGTLPKLVEFKGMHFVRRTSSAIFQQARVYPIDETEAVRLSLERAERERELRVRARKE